MFDVLTWRNKSSCYSGFGNRDRIVPQPQPQSPVLLFHVIILSLLRSFPDTRICHLQHGS